MTQFSKALFSHPFSAAYWKEAAKETKRVRILAIAAICMALKIIVVNFRIPVADNLFIYFNYLITAVQCAICGPVVSVLANGIGDLIEFAIVPQGPFFPGYTLSSMLGALIFSLFLYRTRISISRLAISRLLINIFVNTLLGSLWSFMLYSKGYLYYMAKSIVKNIVLLPAEVFLLVLLFGMLIPILEKRNWIPAQGKKKLRWF